MTTGPFAEHPLWGVVFWVLDGQVSAVCWLCGFTDGPAHPDSDGGRAAARADLDAHLAGEEHTRIVGGFTALYDNAPAPGSGAGASPGGES